MQQVICISWILIKEFCNY